MLALPLERSQHRNTLAVSPSGGVLYLGASWGNVLFTAERQALDLREAKTMMDAGVTLAPRKAAANRELDEAWNDLRKITHSSTATSEEKQDARAAYDKRVLEISDKYGTHAV